MRFPDWFRPYARRIRLAAARAVVRLVDDAIALQLLQVDLLAGETRDGVERFQEYGFTCHPHAGAEAVAVSLGGNRAHTLIIAVDDRRYRVKNLAAGEVCLYTDEDQGGPHRIHLKRGREIHLIAGASSIVMTPAGITITAPSVDFVETA